LFLNAAKQFNSKRKKTNMAQQLDYESLIRVLVNAKVNMVIVGALGMVIRGADFTTFDMDICYEKSPENIERLCRALAPYCAIIRSAFNDITYLLSENERSESFSTDFGKIDMLASVSGLGNYNDVVGFAAVVELGDMTVQTLTLDGLIKAKEAANRPKDQAHLVTLRALKEMENEEDS
jgi:hypothetical protein